jgi:hypothetical protein
LVPAFTTTDRTPRNSAARSITDRTAAPSPISPDVESLSAMTGTFQTEARRNTTRLEKQSEFAPINPCTILVERNFNGATGTFLVEP